MKHVILANILDGLTHGAMYLYPTK